MKPINFIKPISPAHYHSLQRWYRISLCAGIITIVGMVSWTLYDLKIIATLNQEKNYLQLKNKRYAPALEQQEKRAHDRALLIQRHDLLNSMSADTKKYNHCLHVLQKTVHPKALSSIRCNATSFEMCALCNNPQEAFQTIAHLAQDPLLYDVKLTQLHGEDAHYSMTIKARIRETVKT